MAASRLQIRHHGEWALRPRRNPGGLREEEQEALELRGQAEPNGQRGRQGHQVAPRAQFGLGVGGQGCSRCKSQRASPGKEQARNQKAA